MLKNEPAQFDTKFDSTTFGRHWITSKRLRKENENWKNFATTTVGKKIVVNIPLPTPLEREMDSIRNTVAYQQMLTQKRAEGMFDIFKGPHQFPYKLYSDGHHLNQEGERKFSKWFLDELHQFHLQNVKLGK